MATLATIAPFGFDAFNPTTLLPLYRRLGCRTAQFYRSPDAEVDICDARRVAEDAGLPFDSAHGLFGPDLDPSSPDETVRRRTVQVYREEADVALQLGGPQVVVHPAPMRVGEPEIEREQRHAALEQTAVELAVAGERSGVTFLLENVPGNYHFGHDAAVVADIVRGANHPNVRMCLDTGHAHMTEGAAASLGACCDVIAYLHVNDNDGTQDSHDVPGLGTLPWEAVGTLLRGMPSDLAAMLELFESEVAIRRHIDTGLGERLQNWLALQ